MNQATFLCLLLEIACLLSCTGCAVSMAAQAPDRKNLDVLEPGTSRQRVLAELGRPVASRTVKKGRVDSYRFVQGFSKETKAGRALVHGVADFFTAGLWEIAATPAEGYFSGEYISCEILYDDQGRVLQWRTLPENIKQQCAISERPSSTIAPDKISKVAP